jgi:DNA processing protein
LSGQLPLNLDAQRARRGVALSDRQRVSWLRLIRSDNVGPATFRQLINVYGSADAALEALPELARRGGARQSVRIASVSQAERELEAAARMGARIVGIGEPDFPALLRQSDNPPPMVTIKGSAAVFGLPGVSVVGARNASLAGVKFTRKIASDLGSEGYAIVSGLARGIDAAAHQASLSTGTIAVLAGGLDHPYPPENLELFRAIPERGGAVICEMPMGWEPRARDFPRRNRIIAALGLGLVVVEAAKRSGSLISARFAGELGRLVFAVPGSPLDPRSEGANGLIRNGATLITGAADVTEALAPMIGGPTAPEGAEEPQQESDHVQPSDAARERVVEALGQTPVSIDEIIAHTGIRTQEVLLILLELDLAGRLERHSGGRVSLIFVDA